MKYIRFLAMALLCCLVLCIPAMALSAATGLSGNATVAADGSCRVELTLTLKLDTARNDLTFPLPAQATQVLINGETAKTSLQSGKLQAKLPDLSAGQHTLLLRYQLPCVLQISKEQALLSLPLLSGFSLPIQQLEFSVSIPGPITGQPVFFSGYYQENIRLDTTITDNTLVGKITAPLKDHETLRLDLELDTSLFTIAQDTLLSWWDWAGLALMGAAMVYFCLTLLPKFYRHSRTYTAPEGISAGEVGCCLTGSGTDLSMMVLSWAELGYLQLEMDRRGRVLLHKRMEMGNERSYHEGRIFQILFGRREVVDGTSTHFTRVYRKVAGRSPLLRQLFAPRSGDLRIFRGLCCAAGVCCGVQMGADSVLLMVLLGLAALALSFCIQAGCKWIPLRSKLPLLVALACGGVWILLGCLLHCPGRVMAMVAFQFLAGIFAAYGGKRSQLGQRVLTQLMGLRHHMLTASSVDLQKLQQKNPDYFYEMIPYALAMGVDRQFARRFDNKTRLPECGWVLGAADMTPSQCAAKLRQIVHVLDQARYRKL